ncbi:MAG: hypothetical protein UX71_C0010G0030 [Parcubacteria group bacterium GW2011_GWA1_47_10]|nr:MAG: hypothetical protein UX71_C0010G0030 [Parcubacteria group bacterium GW2011_GWA1_47_10]
MLNYTSLSLNFKVWLFFKFQPEFFKIGHGQLLDHEGQRGHYGVKPGIRIIKNIATTMYEKNARSNRRAALVSHALSSSTPLFRSSIFCTRFSKFSIIVN